MKKWFKFFCLSFFSHDASKDGVKRGYTNVFLGFFLAIVFLFFAFIGAEMLPFGLHYGSSPDFASTVRSVFANADAGKRIVAKLEDGVLKVKDADGEYRAGLHLNTFDNEGERQIYSVGGFNVVIDTRPADTLAEIEAYCVSNDGKNTEITYDEYLTLSSVARLNFDFCLKYTGKELVLDDGTVGEYRSYLSELGNEDKAEAERLANELAEEKITKTEYNKAIYQLYFTKYYPEITKYESNSKVPLLRNYYYHKYLSTGICNYLLIFDDYMTGSFRTKGGIDVSFFGFFSGMENGNVIPEGASLEEATAAADSFIKNSFGANWLINAYTHLVNIISLAPYIALMLLVATLLTYSVMKLCGTESISSLGSMFKVVGSYAWFSGAVAAVFALVLSFFVNRSLITALPLVMFFVVLVARSIVFAVKENKLYKEQSEQQTEQTEV